MSVLCRTTTVIVRRGILETAYPGGLAGYQRDCPNQTFRMDEHLTGVGFMVPEDARWFVRTLEMSAGLRGVVRGRSEEVVVIEPSSGPTAPCEWLSYTREGDAAYVWLANTEPGQPAMDHGGLDVDLRWISNEELAGMPMSVSEDGRSLTFLDSQTGNVYYTGSVGPQNLTRPQPGTDAWFREQLRERREAKDTAGAVRVCTTWAAANPDSATIWNELGISAIDDNGLDLAVNAFLQATRLDPDYPEALCNLGAALVQQGLPSEGRRVLERAAQQYPEDAIAWLALSDAQVAVQDDRAAIESLWTARRVAEHEGRTDITSTVDVKLSRLNRATPSAGEVAPHSRSQAVQQSRIRKVGGKPSFVAAHGIAAEHPELLFEHVFALTQLVLDHGGGPVAFTGKNAVIAKEAAMALTHAGFAVVEASSKFTEAVNVELTIDGRNSELLDPKYSGAIVRPVSATQRAKWLVGATQAGFDLVAQHLP